MTNDGAFKACFTYNDTQNDSALPLIVYGYGKVDGQPIILTASVALPNGVHGPALAAWAQSWVSALKQTTVM